MVLGKKYDIDADVMYQKIIKVEENIVNIQKKLVEVRIPALLYLCGPARSLLEIGARTNNIGILRLQRKSKTLKMDFFRKNIIARPSKD